MSQVLGNGSGDALQQTPPSFPSELHATPGLLQLPLTVGLFGTPSVSPQKSLIIS